MRHLHIKPEDKVASRFVDYIIDFGSQVEACIKCEIPFTIVDDNGKELYHCIPVKDGISKEDDEPIPLGTEIGLF